MKTKPNTNHFLSKIDSVIDQAQYVHSTLLNIGSNSQYIVDISTAIKEIVPYLNSAEIEEIEVIYCEAAKQVEDSYKWLYESYSSSDTAAGTVSTTASSISTIISKRAFIDGEGVVQINKYHDFNSIVNRPEIKGEVIKLMRIFHLDISHPGKISPLELFQIAYQAFENPVTDSDPAITSLIPMREAINSTINELLHLRPRQEETGSSDKNKISSIGKQMKKDIISDIVIQQWADLWHDIKDRDLSSSKDRIISRDDWGEKLNRATLFLHGFLTGLDPTKLHQ
ncbi:MAG: hypothetical protein GYA15_15615 [Leptolinea sp.]|jgi:hypothetical protein|nr:hypothetical protein [Leptolinea sp.]